jgi:hypothetical protein
MAWTTTKVIEAPDGGNHRHSVYSVSADSATAVLTTSFKNIVGFSLGLASVATTSRIRGVVVGGTISFICAASGDTFYVTVYGN